MDDPTSAQLTERLEDLEQHRRFVDTFVSRSLLAHVSSTYLLLVEIALVSATGSDGDKRVMAHFSSAAAARRIAEFYKDAFGEEAWPAVMARVDDLLGSMAPTDA